MTNKQRTLYAVEKLKELYPSAICSLKYKNAFELLIATRLSAQCTDARVNMVTPALFEAYPSPYHMAKASVDDIFNYIKSVTFPNNKAKSLLGMANMLVDCYNGEVPSSIDELVKIPGVGRKTANVILSVVFNQAAMAVDTHIFRVSNRIGLTNNSKTPLETERTLVKHIPEELIATAHHWLILHGRYVCTARKPDCLNCGLKPFCKHFNQK
jgi:endonuclease-3